MNRRRQRNIDVTHFEIPSREGLPIYGMLTLPSDAELIVVLIHGFKGFKNWAFFPWLAEFLGTNGIAVCRFDFSRCGITEESDDFDRLDLFQDDTYSHQLDDVKAVVDQLRREQRTARLPIALLGHSRGGAIALIAAREDPQIAAVTTWSAIANTNRWDEETIRSWRRDGTMTIENARTRQSMPLSTRLLDDWEANRERLDVLNAAARLARPLLIIHGGADETVDVADARRLLAAAGRSANLVLIERASHTFGAIHPLIHTPLHLRLAAEVSASFMQTVARRSADPRLSS